MDKRVYNIEQDIYILNKIKMEFINNLYETIALKELNNLRKERWKAQTPEQLQRTDELISYYESILGM